MFSIKFSKFSDCSQCELLDAPSCILETNCEDDLRKVDLIICAENPGKTEIEQERPLVGRAGKVFRKYFDAYLKNFNYLITNCVLCASINKDGTTGNPSDQVIERCKHNLFAMIRICDPKLIFSLGTSPMKALGRKGSISDLRGKLFKWENWNVLPTFHPSYIARGVSSDILTDFENDFKTAKSIVDGSKIIATSDISRQHNVIGKGIFYYTIPDKYYTSDYRLVDVQYSQSLNKVIYIFRDKDNKKEYYQTDDSYVCYQSSLSTRNPMLLSYDNLNQIKIRYRDKSNLDNTITYEGDLKIADKHTIDYHLRNREDAPEHDLNIMFIDIEVDTKKSKEFPDPGKAEFPICLISYHYHGETFTYVLKNSLNIDERTDTNLFIFDDEKKLLLTFINDIRTKNPDIITGWNCISFDLYYLINRINKIGLNIKWGEARNTGDDVFIEIPGFVVIDLLRLYKEFGSHKLENYKLATVAQVELGHTKIFLEEGLSTIYYVDINKFIDYNIKDVMLLVELENKLKFIKFLNELRKICACSFGSCQSTFGRLDTLVVCRLKKKGLASRNMIPSEDSQFPGAYVKEPLKGIYDYIVDLDFTSLYPSLIITYNIGPNTFFCKFKNVRDGYDFIYNRDKMKETLNVIFDPLDNPRETEISRHEFEEIVEKEKLIYTINGCFYKNHSVERSVFSEILIDLMNCRKEMKKLMYKSIDEGDQERKQLYNTRQWAFKILANALYGVLGTHVFRFFNIDLATSVTLSGQEAIKTCILNTESYLKKIKLGNVNKEVIRLDKDSMFNNSDIKSEYVITGDTDSLFVTFQSLLPKSAPVNENVEKLNSIVNELQKYLNEEVIHEIIKMHNVDPNESRLDLKNELVIRRGLFIAKKHYAVYVIRQEGSIVDEIKSVGLETKRSDFSSFTKECLTDLLNMILKSETISISKIISFTKDKEREFITRIKSGCRSVCKPVSFTKDLEKYKVLPQNVRAMEYWNKLMYTYFVPGTKGFLIKIKGIDPLRAPNDVIKKYNDYFMNTREKLDCICFPDEVERLPDFFIVDIKEMVKTNWVDRYNSLLEPILKIDI